MTPKEKAVELVEKFKTEARQDIYDEVFKAYDAKFGREERRTLAQVSDFSAEYHAKKCAILAVKERIAECQLWRDSQEMLTDWELNRLDFLYEVIDEIDKIV